MLVTVQCDDCGLKVKNQAMRSRHNRPCPICGHKYMIDKRDIHIYRVFLVAQVLSKVVRELKNYRAILLSAHRRSVNFR